MIKRLLFYIVFAFGMLPAKAVLPYSGHTVYTNDVNTEEAFNTLTIINSNGDDNTWRYDSNSHSAICYGISSHNNDDWLLTQPFQVEAGKVYEVTFTARAGGASQSESMAIAFGQGTNPAAFSMLDRNLLLDFRGITPQYYFTAKETGAYRAGFHNTAAPGSNAVLVSQIKVTEVTTQAAPRPVSFLTTAQTGAGLRQTVLTFTTPTHNIDGSILTALTKLEVYRNFELIHTLASPATGTRITWTDRTPAQGNNLYTLIAYSDRGMGEPVSTTAFSGEDKPGKVTNVRIGNDGTHDIIRWQKPAKGASYGYFDAANCRYKIYRVENYKYQLVATTEKNDTAVVLDNMGGPQRLITYAVTAVNDGGESDPTVSDEVLTGDPYKLPVRINFEEAINWVNNGWTDSKNHYWWRKETGGVVRYSTNKVIWFKLGGKDGADFNSGKLDLTHAVKPTLTYTVAPEKNTQIEVNAILPDLTVKRLDVHGESTKKQYTVSLASLKGLNNVIIQFHGSSTAADVWAGLYNVNIDDPTENNLATALHTPARMFGAQPAEVTAVVTNYGTKPATGYTVRLYANDKMVAERDVNETLAANESRKTVLTFTPTVNEDSLKLYAVADYAPEQSPEDNTTATVTVPVIQAQVTPVTTLSAHHNGTVNQLAWNKVADDKTTVTDDMESYPAFSLPGDGHYLEYEYHIGPWYNYDADKEYSLDISGYHFNFEEEAFAFITFNADSVKADEAGTAAASTLDVFKAHSGKQFLAAFTMNQDMAMGNKVSDWLISPALSGDAQHISFWYKTLNKSNGTPSFEVAYSTTDSLYTSFTHTVTDTVISMKTAEWQKMTVSLPAGARYFAIHHTTPININQVLMIDDITYERGNGTVTGYKIYRDGNYLTTVTSPAYTDNTGSAHVYNVTVVTGKGESKFSNTASTTTGISCVENKTTSANTATYNMAGQQVDNNYKGIIIRKGKKIIRK